MPTYEYACKNCGHQWEVVQRITEDPIEVCPKCGQKTAQRLISGGNFILKGGGWYADLYSKPPSKSSNAGSGDGKASGSSSESKSSGTASGDSGASSSKGESSGASKPAAKDS